MVSTHAFTPVMLNFFRQIGSLQDRLSQLQTAQTTWQNKVGEKDAGKFTVAGKMGAVATPIARQSRKDSEMNARNSNNEAATTPASATSKTAETPTTSRQRSTPQMRRFHGSPPPAGDSKYDETNDTEDAFEALLGEEFSVEVPDVNEDLDKFFTTSSGDPPSSSSISVNIEDFDALADSSPDDQKLLVNHKKNFARPGNRYAIEVAFQEAIEIISFSLFPDGGRKIP